jgi:hypothetical protein
MSKKAETKTESAKAPAKVRTPRKLKKKLSKAGKSTT